MKNLTTSRILSLSFLTKQIEEMMDKRSIWCSGKRFFLLFSRVNDKPYLETTTSEQVEYTKAFEITIIKELGKLTP